MKQFKHTKQILIFVSNYLEKNRYAPSYDDIMEELGLKSRSSVGSSVKPLLKHGLLGSTGEPRTLHITDKGKRYLRTLTKGE